MLVSLSDDWVNDKRYFDTTRRVRGRDDRP